MQWLAAARCIVQGKGGDCAESSCPRGSSPSRPVPHLYSTFVQVAMLGQYRYIAHHEGRPAYIQALPDGVDDGADGALRLYWAGAPDNRWYLSRQLGDVGLVIGFIGDFPAETAIPAFPHECFPGLPLYFHLDDAAGWASTATAVSMMCSEKPEHRHLVHEEAVPRKGQGACTRCGKRFKQLKRHLDHWESRVCIVEAHPITDFAAAAAATAAAAYPAYA